MQSGNVCFFEDSKHVYKNQNTTHRTRTRLKGLHWAIPVSTFVVRRTRIVFSLYAALSKEAEVMVAELTGHAAANVNAPYERKLGVLKICPFPN